MKRDLQDIKAVNRRMLLSSVAAIWGYATWPNTGASLLDWMFPATMAALAVGGVIFAARGLVEDLAHRRMKAKAERPSGKHGKAKFADVSERLAAGLHDLNGFAFLGLCEDLPTLLPKGNLLIEAMAGSGKTSRVLVMTILQALWTGRSVIVADSKPEFVGMLGDLLRRQGFRVKINNPTHKEGLPHDDYNPFQILVDVARDHLRAHETMPLAETLAKVLVPDANDGKSKYFIQLDQQVLTAVFVALSVLRPKLCYPAQIWKHLSDPDAFEDLLFEAKESDALGGDLAITAKALLRKDRDNPDHLEGAKTGAANALSVFKPSSSYGQFGADHSYQIQDARDEDKPPMVIFDVFPADQLEVAATANELTNTTRIQALKRYPSGREIVFIADEFTAFPIRPIATEVEFIRSFKIRFVAAYQSWASLKRVYGEARAESLKANCAQLYFSVNDLATAKSISERIGDYTIKTESFGFGENSKPTRNLGETGRRRVPPEELLSMGREHALLMVPGMHPVKLETVPWYEIAPIKDQLGENPHERHPKSPVTQLIWCYDENADELGPPVVPDFEERLARARQMQRAESTPEHVPLFRPYKFLWVPLVTAFLGFVLTTGTPHFSWMQAQNRNGGWTCGYLGIAGFELVTSDRRCPFIAWLPPHAEEL